MRKDKPTIRKRTISYSIKLLAVVLIFMACSEDNMPVSNEIPSVGEIENMRLKAAPAGLIFNEMNGNYYQAVEEPGLTWDEALEASQGLTYKSCKGHLATITSQNESDWIVANIPQAVTEGYWIGGKQAVPNAGPFEDWSWVTGENWIYTNWNGGEPNDFEGIEEESLQFSPAAFGGGGGGWNDQVNEFAGLIDEFGNEILDAEGYLVEYDCGAKVTGSGNRNGDLPQISMVAQKDTDTNVRGQAQVKYPKGVGAFHVSVSCLSVWGNEAWIGGTVTKSTFAPFPTGTEILWAVADNGEGGGAEDNTSGYFYFPDGSPIADNCALQDLSIGYPVAFSTKGNIQIH